MKLNRRLSCALMLLVMCVGLTAFGALLQVLNIVPDPAERTQTAEVQDLPTRIAMANATRHVELTATVNARPTTATLIVVVPTVTPRAIVAATVDGDSSDVTAPSPVLTPTSTLTDLEAVEIGIATAEAVGLPLKVIFERFDGVTGVEVVYITFWDSDTVSVEARLMAPQSIVDQLLTASMEYVPEMTELHLTVTSPDGISVDYTWETVNPYWRPLSMNGELLPTRAAQP